MHADGRRWGSFEIAFQVDKVPGWLLRAKDPLFARMGFNFVACLITLSLYMRRALQHLDPAHAIPERVQGAS